MHIQTAWKHTSTDAKNCWWSCSALLSFTTHDLLQYSDTSSCPQLILGCKTCNNFPYGKENTINFVTEINKMYPIKIYIFYKNSLIPLRQRSMVDIYSYSRFFALWAIFPKVGIKAEISAMPEKPTRHYLRLLINQGIFILMLYFHMSKYIYLLS